MHVSFAVLQALDVHSTLRAVTSNGHEANPLLGGVADNSAALSAIKAGVTAATILANERLWKTHRRAALILMAAENAAYLTIVAHNYRVSGRP
jgi:ABC-type sugar transport system substrate-binding protein